MAGFSAHGGVGFFAMTVMTVFFVASLVSELSFDPAAILWVKTAVMYGLFVLIPLMIATVISGRMRVRGRTGRLIGSKTKRMIALLTIGLFVLTPSAVYLRYLAAAGDFGALFYVIQGVEWIAGATNIALMALNARDGLKLSGRLRVALKKA